MADATHACRKDFRDFDAVANESGGSAKGEEKGGAGDAVRHAESAVDNLACKADKDGNQQSVGHSGRVNRGRGCAERKKGL